MLMQRLTSYKLWINISSESAHSGIEMSQKVRHSFHITSFYKLIHHLQFSMSTYPCKLLDSFWHANGNKRRWKLFERVAFQAITKWWSTPCCHESFISNCWSLNPGCCFSWFINVALLKWSYLLVSYPLKRTTLVFSPQPTISSPPDSVTGRDTGDLKT